MTEPKSFQSVSELVRATVEDSDCADKLDDQIAGRQIVKKLTILRVARKLSQKDIAAKLGCSQSRVSKIESGRDLDMSLGDLMAYLEAVGFQLNLSFIGNEQPMVEQTKF